MNRSPLPLIVAAACLLLAAAGGAALLAWDDLAGGGCPDCPPQPTPAPAPVPVKPKPKPEPKPQPKPPPCPNCPRFDALPAHGFAQIQLGGPELDGVAVACDYPLSEAAKWRNKGGSDGQGLCVYAANSNAANWAGMRTMAGIFEWARSRPGGSYPTKWAKDVTEYCKWAGIPEPPYVQITNGDIEVLYAASRTRRMMSTTYGGHDGVLYRNEKPIGHMVSLLHCDPKVTCLVCNNFPDKYLWLDTQKEFVPRWMDNGGGWAVVWEEPGPTPVPTVGG